MVVYVGGVIGQRALVVASRPDVAMVQLLDYMVSDGEENGYPQQWDCKFIDGEPGTGLLWTLTLPGVGKPYHLYIEQQDIEEPEVS